MRKVLLMTLFQKNQQFLSKINKNFNRNKFHNKILKENNKIIQHATILLGLDKIYCLNIPKIIIAIM
jgi:wobble nucleotide-excising tRNase